MPDAKLSPDHPPDLEGAILNLEGAIVPHDIELTNCWIDGKIALIAVSTRRIDLNGSRLAELSADAVEIKGDLFLRDRFHQCNHWRLQPFTFINFTLRKGVAVEKHKLEDSFMSRRIVVALLGLGLCMFLIPQIALATLDQVAEAITHTKKAIEHGKIGHADVLKAHAGATLIHAKAAGKAKPNPHTEEAIKHLEQAIVEGKNGHADTATTHAEAALAQLEQVK